VGKLAYWQQAALCTCSGPRPSPRSASGCVGSWDGTALPDSFPGHYWRAPSSRRCWPRRSSPAGAAETGLPRLPPAACSATSASRITLPTTYRSAWLRSCT
jgi:hypothetical protein